MDINPAALSAMSGMVRKNARGIWRKRNNGEVHNASPSESPNGNNTNKRNADSELPSL
jgi:hypothetical protein